MSNRHRWRGTTTQRGLGADHQRIRRQRMAALRDGQPCPRTEICGGLPMYATAAAAARAGLPRKLWLLDLDDYPGRWYGGPQIKRLAHRYCNRRAGQLFGARLRAAKRRLPPPRTW
jgi:hypothetical protein